MAKSKARCHKLEQDCQDSQEGYQIEEATDGEDNFWVGGRSDEWATWRVPRRPEASKERGLEEKDSGNTALAFVVLEESCTELEPDTCPTDARVPRVRALLMRFQP